MSDIWKGKNTFKRADAGHRYFCFARAVRKNKGKKKIVKALRIVTLNINPNSPVSLQWVVQYTSEVGQTRGTFWSLRDVSFWKLYGFVHFYRVWLLHVRNKYWRLVRNQSTPCNTQDHLGIVISFVATVWSVNEFRNSAPSIHFARHWSSLSTTLTPEA